MMMCGAKRTWSWWLWMGGSTAVAVLAVTVALLWNSIFTALLSSLLVLSPGTQTYERWIAPDQPLFFEVFLFNWTNPDKLPKEKPRLEQLGPYRFREVRKHVNVTVHHHNSSVSYRTQRSWFFDEETTNGSLKDIVTTINMMTATAMFQKRHSAWEQSLLAMTLSVSNTLSVTKTVGEMLFDGYQDNLLTVAKYLPKPTEAPIPEKFGWFVTKNNSIDTDGFMEVTSGAGDRPIGEILKWNHHDSVPFYEGRCGRMAGSAGEFIQRNLTANSTTLTLFMPDLCRTLDLPHTSSGVLDGLEYHRFDMLEQNFDKSSVTTENNCFCNGECKWSGVMNVSACQFDSPTFLSLPHFLYGDPALREAVDGMDPDPEKHSFYFAVEPTLGVPIDVAGRFQFNIYLAPVWSWPKNMFSDVPNTLFPVFWVQQKVKVQESTFSELRLALAIGRWGGLPFVAIGLACAAVVVFCSSKKPKYISISTR